MATVRTLIDTGPIVATLNERDPHHAACAAAFKTLGSHAFTCWPVITEAAYLLGDWSPGTRKLFALLRGGVLQILPIRISDIDGIEKILAKYADQKLQLADATLMFLAERENIDLVLCHS